MTRQKMTLVLELAKQCIGSYDEWPCLEAGIDPMVYLSRNRVRQPFYLSGEKDRVLVHMGGEGRVEFRDASVNYYDLDAGDCVYLPAGIPARVVPQTPCLQLVYRGEPWPGETAHWFCEGCGAPLRRIPLAEPPGSLQRAAWEACRSFDEDLAARTCRRCGAVHPKLDLSDIR